MSNAIETAMFLRRYQSWRKGEIDVFYPDSHAGPNPVEISAAIDRAIVALETQPPCGADGAVLASEIKRACAYYKQAGRVASVSPMLAKQHEATADKIIDAALLASRPADPVAPATVAVPESKRSCFTCKHADADDESYPCRDCTMMAHWSSSASQRKGGAA